MFGWLWGCLMLIKVDLRQLPIDTFATDQPTDPFALTRYNVLTKTIETNALACLGVFNVDLGQLPFDTFATDQPTDHFALS